MPATATFLPPAPDAALQPAFDALLQDACATLAAHAGDLLDGIYLYGSIARGDATPGVSDLDLTLVLRQAPAPAHAAALETLRQALQARHPEVLKVDFDIGHRAQVLAPEHLYSWGYWLKHQCRCLWGDDLSTHFAPFAPSRAIAMAVNGDFAHVLDDYARRLERATEPAAIARLQREASRKLIRSTNILRRDGDACWPASLDEHAQLFLRRHPGMRAQLACFLAQARPGAAPADGFVPALRQFTRWLARQQAI
ncbi:nucleotidyltransferase domain-containing protein [Janthinobacterium sp. 1_2014MBL_MicDiv]|uniref:nucleotidyltransferase domain-containing protein n=1 Tax=Janthinobacterium sp. 1_2014MBL_MicDiv TaxID=1644131 RepID=UPI0008F5278E|nr:nucleotidyltransferase domain-containing protein [Janthinobacterium sp. 1_2014MBL_MicDiv]APA68385.1 DNA polymerase III subunit beta [Janthinobacterium sp. 1_2014MBL_MicDiv]